MRRLSIPLIVAFVLLVGCAGTVGGTGMVDPNAATTTGPSKTISTGSSSTTPSSSESSTTTTSSTTESSTESSSTESSSESSSTESSTTESTTSSESTESSETGAIPDGFKHWDSDIAYRAMDPATEFSCGDGQDVCFGLELYSAAGCDAGISVDLNVYATADETAEPIGQAGSVSPPVPAGATGQVIVGFSSAEAAAAEDPSADLIDIHCG